MPLERDKNALAAGAVPGGGKKVIKAGSKDAYKLKTAAGYKTAAEVATEYGPARTLNEAGDKMYEWSPGQAQLFDQASGTSIFDPVLCELAYRWFCPPGGKVLDPFAGGSVRGIVASKLGLKYVGVDLSARQIAANQAQGAALCPDNPPTWINGNSLEIEALAGQHGPFDLVFSCPPYADLEVYSNDPRDLSAMPYAKFVEVYRGIITAACRMLRPNRYAAWVVGEVRDGNGNYYGFVPDTIAAFRAAGLHYYNEAILVTAVGSLPVRAGRQFSGGRKLGKSHQNFLGFVKGDGKLAAKACGEIT